MKIFLSVGRTFTDAQEQFVLRIEDYLRAQGLTPQTVGRSYFSSQQPLKAINILMNECAGTIVVALERTFFPQAIDRPGSPKEQIATNTRLPTVWNQIEAAMAYVRGHPLLLLVEHGLKSEGLLEKGYDWYVLWVDIQRMPFSDPESAGVFADWKQRLSSVRPQPQLSNSIAGRHERDEEAHRHHLTDLRRRMVATLGDEELQTLCFDLGVDYESLKGQGKEAKARELVIQCDRKGKLSQLVELCRAMIPAYEWPSPD